MSIFAPASPAVLTVENPCGKTCGECGKLKFINSYFGSLDSLSGGSKGASAVFITFIFMGNRTHYVTVLWMLFPAETRRKSWIAVIKCCQRPASKGVMPKFFVQLTQKCFWYRMSPAGDTVVITIYTGGTPCKGQLKSAG